MSTQSLSPASAAKAQKELSEPEDPTAAAEIVASVRGRVVKVQGAEEAERWDWALLATLRQCKWDEEKALEGMKGLSHFAAKRSALFKSLSAEEFVGQASIGMISHLPTRNERGELVLLINGSAMNELAQQHTMQDVLRYSVWYMCHLMKDEETQVNGAIIIENLHNYPMLALNRMQGAGPTGIKASFEWLRASPLRLRGIYAIHQPWYVGMMLTMVRPFMSTKMQSRVALFGSDTAAMLSVAGLKPEQVPTEYGGTLSGFDSAWFVKGQVVRTREVC